MSFQAWISSYLAIVFFIFSFKTHIIFDGLGPKGACRWQAGVEMRKQFAIAGRLPFQFLTERIGFEGDQKQVAAPGVMFLQRPGKLIAGREMDEAVALVMLGAFVRAGILRSFPFFWRAYFIDEGHVS